VASGPHRDFQPVRPRELDSVQDIISVSASCHQFGPFLRAGVPKVDSSCGLISRVRGENETAFQLCAEFCECVSTDLVSVVDPEATAGCHQPQCAGYGERPFDELATILMSGEIHILGRRL
jgi:hypothetical protein